MKEMNQLEVGKRVFSIHHSDGKAHPTVYFLEQKGIVDRMKTEEVGKRDYKVIAWGHMSVFDNMEDKFLKPSSDGFCYFMAELPDMEQYKIENEWGTFYQVPTKTLKEHMKSYKSPW